MRDTAIEDLIDARDLEALYRPTGQARGLPGVAYGEEFYRLEQRRFFPRLWCPVGFASDIPNPGDAVPVDLAGWSILLLRGEDGAVRAFHNVCRHRAMELVQEPCSGLKRLTCPWHAWSYDLDGRLLATPIIGGERQNTSPAFDRTDTDLRPIRMAQWLDLIFVNIDGKAPPFEQHVAPLSDLVGVYDYSTMRRSDSWETTYPSNWKLAVETALEEYHIPFGHPQLAQGVRRHNALGHRHDLLYYATSNDREYGNRREADPAMGVGLDMPNVPLSPGHGSSPSRSYFIIIFPTGAMQTRVNHSLLGLMLPDGPARTKVRFVHYYPGEAAVEPAFAEVRANLVDAWKHVFGQDVPFARGTQKNAELRDEIGLGTRFSPFWEENLQNFQQMVVETIRQA